MWNARCIKKLLDVNARESKESHQLGWLEKSRRKPARVVAGGRRRAAASASASRATAGAALTGAGAITASSITA
jgi:hypothetical protein